MNPPKKWKRKKKISRQISPSSVCENPLKLSFLLRIPSNCSRNISQKALVVNNTCLHCVNSELKVFGRSTAFGLEYICEAVFMITSRRANTLISFFFIHSLRVYSNVLRRAMKVDKHKYNDVFLGAINSSFERFSMIFIKMLNWRVWGFFALRFSHFMALNKSFLNAIGEREKICFSAFTVFARLTYRNQTTHLEIRQWIFGTFWQLFEIWG